MRCLPLWFCKVGFRKTILNRRKGSLSSLSQCFSKLSTDQNHLKDFIKHRLLSATSRVSDLVGLEVGLRTWISNSFQGGDDTLHPGPHCGNHWVKRLAWGLPASKPKTLFWTGIHLHTSCVVIILYLLHTLFCLCIRFCKIKHFQFLSLEFVLVYY